MSKAIGSDQIHMHSARIPDDLFGDGKDKEKPTPRRPSPHNHVYICYECWAQFRLYGVTPKYCPQCGKELDPSTGGIMIV